MAAEKKKKIDETPLAPEEQPAQEPAAAGGAEEAVHPEPAKKKPAKKKAAAEQPAPEQTDAGAVPPEKTKEEKIAALIEKGKKAGKLTSKELSDALDNLGLSPDELDAVYDQLEDLGVDTTGDEFLPPLEDDALPALEELEELE